VALIKNDHGKTVVASRQFNWQPGNRYEFSLTAVGDRFEFNIDSSQIFDYTDAAADYFDYGMYGFALLGSGRCLFEGLTIVEK